MLENVQAVMDTVRLIFQIVAIFIALLHYYKKDTKEALWWLGLTILLRV